MGYKIIPLFVTLALVLAACGSAGEPGDAGSANQGQDLFVLNCGECHGNDATGSDEAPVIIGHTLEQVREQVRTPEGDMEAIPPDKLSDADLELIAQFVAGLGEGEEAHEADISPSAEERVHLMAAYEAIEDYENMDREAGIEHLKQAAALATGETAELYEELIEAIEAKKAGTARHELKELLGIMEM
jgi:mono/diheme cytochrome c family protein